MSEQDDKKQEMVGGVARGFSELIVGDLFNKHGISETRKLTAEQKEQVKQLVEDLQRQVDQFMKAGTVSQKVEEDGTTNTAPASTPGKSAPAPSLTNNIEQPKRRRLQWRKKD